MLHLPHLFQCLGVCRQTKGIEAAKVFHSVDGFDAVVVNNKCLEACSIVSGTDQARYWCAQHAQVSPETQTRVGVGETWHKTSWQEKQYADALLISVTCWMLARLLWLAFKAEAQRQERMEHGGKRDKGRARCGQCLLLFELLFELFKLLLMFSSFSSY